MLSHCWMNSTFKMIDSALGLFMKVVDNSLSFSEHFESSQLDICSSRYSQNTERCSDTDQGHGPCRRPVCVNFHTHGPCKRTRVGWIRAHPPCRHEHVPCWRFFTLKTIESALAVFMKVVDNSLRFSYHFESSKLDICSSRYLQNTKRCSIWNLICRCANFV